MSSWTPDRVLALAPDAAAASAGRGLATAKSWVEVGRSDRAVWGLCQGSGKQPYQTRVDLSEPAFKCSCPSRKFPCKHGLGLMLLLAQDESKFKHGPEPGWVAEWLESRGQRAERKADKAREEAEKPVDVEAQAKRAAQRESRVLDGVAGCRVWLEDLVRGGLASAKGEPAATWDRMAARMVDAQAPGLAAQVRRIPELLASGEGWDVRTLDRLGRIHLLLRAAERLGELPADLAMDVRTALGWAQGKEQALGGESIADRWLTLGQIVEDEDRLRVRRTWLVGAATGRRALVLDFAAGATPLDPSLWASSEFEGEVAFYPGRLPLRGLVKARGESQALGPRAIDLMERVGDATTEQALAGYAAALAASPWLLRWPMLLRRVRPVLDGARWYLVDGCDAGLPLAPSFAGSLACWKLVSAAGSGPIDVLAEWDGQWALPLGAITPRGFHDLAPKVLS